MEYKPSRKLVWFLFGVLSIALPMGCYWLKTGHHYSEHGTFFRGALGEDRQVVGIAFVEYDGIGIMELTKWKVQVLDRYGHRMTLYQKSSVFQEKTPHTPKVKIKGNQIHIDDGEEEFLFAIQITPKTDR